MADEGPPRPGFRKDGKPYKEGNTDEDGSYVEGKGRTPKRTRFAADDGRPRGRRPKGTRNLATDWHEELSEKITVTENGKARRMSKQRGIIKQTASRALKGNDRAAEIVLRHAGSETARPRTLSLSDEQILARWLEQRAAPAPVDPVAETAGDAADD